METNMSKTLGGACFGWNAISQDYSIIESLECLYEMCDEVCVVYGGTDGTVELIKNWINSKPEKKPIWHLEISEREWNAQHGREKLSYFSNLAISNLDTDWVYYQQADEITHESSFPIIRQAIESDEEAFVIHRINLWCSPYMRLDVPQERKPVSTEVIRLAKAKYRCIGDAESLGVPSVGGVIDVNMYHMGFVRDRKKHIGKIIHMQKDVFLMDYDKRVDDCHGVFNPWKFGFTPKDLQPIDEPLPKYIQEWAKDRVYIAFKYSEYEMAKEFLIHIGYDMSNISILKYPELTTVFTANEIIDSLGHIKMTNSPKQID
jgi:hypothetical protein